MMALQSRINDGRDKFCSKKCLSLWMSNNKSESKHPNWKGGKYKVSGYVYVLSKNHPHKSLDGYVLEHRLEMEKYLNRFLLPAEVVHHINGIRDDNRVENLELYQDNSQHFKEEHQHFTRNSYGRFVSI
ncbi:MAG TPA: hypothetical protein ENH65_13795 [Candidatus Aminicenantes bacterium]|nr:hypothetical protein [Candidatus Aminicenantes bacterium]